MRTYPSRPGPHVPTKADAGVPDPHVQVGCGPNAFTRRRPGLRRPKPGPLLLGRPPSPAGPASSCPTPPLLPPAQTGPAGAPQPAGLPLAASSHSAPPRVTRTACSGASGEALCLQDKLPGVQDPLQSGHRLPFLPLRLPLSPPGPSFPSPMSRRQSCGLFSRLAACSPLRASPRALPSAQATFPRSLQPRGAGVS